MTVERTTWAEIFARQDHSVEFKARQIVAYNPAPASDGWANVPELQAAIGAELARLGRAWGPPCWLPENERTLAKKRTRERAAEKRRAAKEAA